MIRGLNETAAIERDVTGASSLVRDVAETEAVREAGSAAAAVRMGTTTVMLRSCSNTTEPPREPRCTEMFCARQTLPAIAAPDEAHATADSEAAPTEAIAPANA